MKKHRWLTKWVCVLHNIQNKVLKLAGCQNISSDENWAADVLFQAERSFGQVQLQFLKRSVSGHIGKCTNNKKDQNQTVVKSENYEHIYTVGAKERILILGLATFLEVLIPLGIDWKSDFAYYKYLQVIMTMKFMEACFIPE